jgi:hypothetical protein
VFLEPYLRKLDYSAFTGVMEEEGVEGLEDVRAAIAELKANLNDIKYVSFPEKAVVFPVFACGKTKGGEEIVGVFSVRVDT